MGSKKYYEELVQRFVEILNTQSFEPQTGDELPESLRGPSLDLNEMFNWKIQKAPSNPWVASLEQKLPRRYPDAFRALISGYRFSYFEVGPIMFFANTGRPVSYELVNRVFADKHMSSFLLQNGYLQFGQAAVCDYDPICFAPRGLNDKRESRIVRLDHEQILINNRLKITAEIAASIENFMQRTADGEFEVC